MKRQILLLALAFVPFLVDGCIGDPLEGKHFACDPDGDNTCEQGYICVRVLDEKVKGVCLAPWEDAFRVAASNFQLSKMMLVSAFPAMSFSGNVQRSCKSGDDSNGIVLYLTLIGVGAWSGSESDRSIRPGDVVKVLGSSEVCVLADKNGPKSSAATCVLAENSVSLSGECIEKYPDEDLADATYKCGDMELAQCSCQGQCPQPCTLTQDVCSCPEGVCPSPCTRQGRGITIEDFRYWSYLQSQNGDYGYTRDEKLGRLGVAVLIDMSGSTKGWVDSNDREVLVDRLAFRGSDPNVQRAAAVKNFLNSLDPTDKSIVFVFGEYPLEKDKEVKGAKVLCFDVKGGTPENDLRQTCFSTDRSLVLADHKVGQNIYEAELDRLQYYPERSSRAPLWSAIKDAYEFMRDKADTDVRHIIVIDDGPDTCDPSSPYFVPYIGAKRQLSCGDGTTFANFEDEVEKDLQDAKKPKVAISFIQFQALGYLERDPRQTEIACLTGGHYIFLNTVEPNKLDQVPLQDVMVDAIMKLRYALIGSWALYFKLPGEFYQLDKGAIYSFRGEIDLKKDVGGTISKVDQVLRLDVGTISSQGEQIPLDLRPAIRLGCRGVGDCGWFIGTPPACRKAGCGVDTGLCEWVRVEDNSSCGGGSVCCNGYCAQVTECK